MTLVIVCALCTQAADAQRTYNSPSLSIMQGFFRKKPIIYNIVHWAGCFIAKTPLPHPFSGAAFPIIYAQQTHVKPLLHIKIYLKQTACVLRVSLALPPLRISLCYGFLIRKIEPVSLGCSICAQIIQTKPSKILRASVVYNLQIAVFIPHLAILKLISLLLGEGVAFTVPHGEFALVFSFAVCYTICRSTSLLDVLDVLPGNIFHERCIIGIFRGAFFILKNIYIGAWDFANM